MSHSYLNSNLVVLIGLKVASVLMKPLWSRVFHIRSVSFRKTGIIKKATEIILLKVCLL